MPKFSTWLIVEQKGVKFGTRGVIVTCMCGTFDLLVFNVILASSGALVSKWPVTQNRLAVERNGVKFGTQG